MTDTLAGPAQLDEERDRGAYHRSAEAAVEPHPVRVGYAPAPGRIELPIANRLDVNDRPSRGSGPSPTRLGLAPARRLTRAAPTRGARHRSTAARYLVPGWPLKALLVGFPLWWVLGLTTFIFPILAVPMLLELRRRRPWRFPPFFWMWALFLLWNLLSLAMFNASPPGTHTTPTGGRLLSNAVSLVEYASVTITLLYVGMLSVKEVSQRTIARWMGWFFLTVVGGGFLGVVAPHFQFRSAIEYLLPRHLRANPYIASLVHPIAAQVQNVLGDAAGRPAAPFGYTNSWGNTLGILIAWFIAAWVIPARSWKRAFYATILVAAFVPILLSLNRGLWLGLIAAGVWFAARLLARGRVEVLVWGAGGLAVAIGLFFLTPAHSLVQSRLENGKSNSIRSFVAQQSFTALANSPVIGYGGPRHTNGSAQSIAVGKSANCSSCGDVASGSTGTFWAIMFNQGAGGLFFYFGFFIACLWTYRRERTPIDEAALVGIAVLFVYMFFYNTLPAAPTLTMVGVAVLWRSQRVRTGSGDPAPLRTP